MLSEIESVRLCSLIESFFLDDVGMHPVEVADYMFEIRNIVDSFVVDLPF